MSPRRPRKLSIHKLIPNMITLGALSSGMSSVKFAVAGRWEEAVLAIVAAMLLDAVDGAAARLLKAASKLGAELDSLSDFVSFGVAPGIVVFLWSMQDIGRWGWFIALVYAMAIALRLARFNIMKEEAPEAPGPLGRYFTGVPSPLAAGLCILPMIVSFMFDDHAPALSALWRSPALTGIWALVVAGLAVSHVPTFSTRQMRVPYRMKVPALAFFGLLIAGLINDPWPTLTFMAVAYLAALPLGILHYNRKEKALAAGHKDPDDVEAEQED
jgi:CDP-diacylglycerol--serine O-phosphatidyltransferase